MEFIHGDHPTKERIFYPLPKCILFGEEFHIQVNRTTSLLSTIILFVSSWNDVWRFILIFEILTLQAILRLDITS